MKKLYKCIFFEQIIEITHQFIQLACAYPEKKTRIKPPFDKYKCRKRREDTFVCNTFLNEIGIENNKKQIN